MFFFVFFRFFFAHSHIPASGQAVVTGVVPFFPPGSSLQFLLRIVDFSSSVANSRSRAFPSQFVHMKKSPRSYIIRVCTRRGSNSRNWPIPGSRLTWYATGATRCMWVAGIEAHCSHQLIANQTNNYIYRIMTASVANIFSFLFTHRVLPRYTVVERHTIDKIVTPGILELCMKFQPGRPVLWTTSDMILGFERRKLPIGCKACATSDVSAATTPVQVTATYA